MSNNKNGSSSPDTGSLRQRQEDELEVIKAIYVGDVHDEVNIPSKPLQFTVRLLPQRGSSGGGGNAGPKVPTFLVLYVTIPLDYPQTSGPDLRIGESKGLSSQEISELVAVLQQMTSESMGDEMMYQVLSFAETFLYTHQKRSIGSFHDEMLMRQKQLEEKNVRKQIDRKEKERLAIKEEILRKQNEEREELRKIKERRSQAIATATTNTTTFANNNNSTTADDHSSTSPGHSPTNSSSSPVKGDNFPMSFRGRVAGKRRLSTGGGVGGGNGKQRSMLRSNSEGSDSSYSESSDLVLLEFMCGKNSNLFYRGEALGKSERGTTVYAGMSRTGNLVAISEWKLVAKVDKKGKELKFIGAGDSMTLDGAMKQLHSIELEMNLFHKLEHPNIVLYCGMKAFSPVDEPGTITVYLAEEFVRGTTIQSYLQGTLAFDLSLLRHCAQGVLEGLKYLHDNDIVHRYLRDTSIFLDTAGAVRITDYGVERKISELHYAFNKLPNVPDKFPPSIGRGGKKCDIYRFGAILLSLINGSYIQAPPLEIPTMLPPELQDFLRKCLTPVEHSRWSAAELLDHQFLKSPFNPDSPLKLPCPSNNKAMDENKKKIENDDDEEDDDEGDEANDVVPQSLPHLFKGHSRVESEFQIMKFLGKGGFGDVLKVKNKLDGRIYALKRIKLNPRNKQLNKKITREVKLLSQLNHENVVRYFNSWIETVIESDDEGTTTSESISLDVSKLGGNNNKVAPSAANPLLAVHFQSLFKKQQNSLGLADNIEDLAPAMTGDTSEWDPSSGGGGGSSSLAQRTYSDESDESSDEDDLFGTSFRRITMEDSDEIVFEPSDSPPKSGHHNTKITPPQQSEENSTKDNSDNASAKVSTPKASTTEEMSNNNMSTTAPLSLTSFLHESQFLYIQMEFCEKSTLKTAIDNNLCEDLDRAWRLFREIVEGLVHIHQQGMIHRDLKPVNIFLDWNDHVKIGDFGLASSIIPKRPNESVVMQDEDLMIEPRQCLSPDTDDTRTGQVGTALYIAPELITTGQKATCNQKVDIYSLGVMFFEMFYHPSSTAMERVRVIMGLRQSAIVFPKDFDQTLLPQVTFITKWLLDHNHAKRPTSLELLQSDYLPPPHLEEAELRDIFQRTLRSSKTKSYKYLVASCFSQEVSPVEDASYDMDGGKNFATCLNLLSSPTGTIAKSLYFVHRVKRIIRQVFERHGATELHTPLLLPKSNLYENVVDTCVNLMCHSGGIVSIPHDLRVPFARYVGRNGINHFKRFTIDKVFRERKVYGLHPRELIECAFDIVDSSQGSLISDAEVLSVTFEILHELPWLRSRNCTIRLGHTKLLLGVFLHHAVDEKHFDKITKLLSEVKNERDSKQQIQTHLCSLGLSDHFVTMLLQLMGVEGSFSKISSMLKGIMKRKGEAASAIKEALHELEILITNIETFGIKCNITVTPALTFSSQIYSGLLFQVVCSDLKRRKNKMTMDVIAAGGRYDNLIQEFRTSMYLDGNAEERKDDAPCGVGISISLDKLIAGFEFDEDDDNNIIGKEWARSGSVDVLICALGHHPMNKEKIDMMKELLLHGIHASVLDASQTLESAEEYCKEIGAIFLVILKEGEYFNNIRVRLWERGRFNEKKLSKSEVIELISRTLHDGCNNEQCLSQSGGGISRSDSVSVKQGGLLGTDMMMMTCCPLAAGNSHSHAHSHHGSGGGHGSGSGASIGGSGSGLPTYNISILMQEREKLLSHLKKKYENQIMSRISDILSKLGRQTTVEVLGLEANITVLNNLASSLAIHDKDEFAKSVGEVIEKHPRLKKYLKGICDLICDLIYEKNTSVIIVFGLADNSYRVLL